MNCSQELPKTPDSDEEESPQLIPIKVGLVESDGEDLPLTSVEDGAGRSRRSARPLPCAQDDQTARSTFKDIAVKPVPSVLRNFSAPVKLVIEQSNEDLKFLLANDWTSSTGGGQAKAGHQADSGPPQVLREGGGYANGRQHHRGLRQRPHGRLVGQGVQAYAMELPPRRSSPIRLTRRIL